MIEPRLQAVRQVREEADNLRLACIAAVEAKALLHIAYDSTIKPTLPLDQAVLLGRLRGLPS